ncbi:MAG: endonuclease, partial [Pseudomonadota bacterium]
MREPVQTVTEAMEPPSREARCLAAAGDRTAALHADYLATWPCLTTIEARQPADTQPPPEITVAAWNIERCKRVPESAALLKTTGADIVLATEMDW